MLLVTQYGGGIPQRGCFLGMIPLTRSLRNTLKVLSPRRGIEPRSPAWQSGILTTILSRITAKLQPTIGAILAHVSETSGSFQVWSWVHSIAANGSHVGTVTPHYMLYWMHECMVSFLCCTNISRWGLIIMSSFEVKPYNPSYQVV